MRRPPAPSLPLADCWTVLPAGLAHIIMPCLWQWGAAWVRKIGMQMGCRRRNGTEPIQRDSAQRTAAKEIYCTANTRCLSWAEPGHNAQLIYQPQITATIREHRTSNIAKLNSWSILVGCMHTHTCTQAHMHTIVPADYIVV